jgi:hypothetical protein
MSCDDPSDGLEIASEVVRAEEVLFGAQALRELVV